MANLANVLVVAFVVFSAVQIASACSDSFPRGYCSYQKVLGTCSMPTVRILCKKTCGDCGGGVLPTFPPVPVTKMTQKPYPTPPLPPTGRPTPGKCGVPMASSSRVIAGTRASRGAWPWQIRLLNRGRGGCGGTLVSPTWVVTAAHCVQKNPSASLYSVEVGSTDLNSFEPHRKTYSVSRVIMHPNYDRSRINNDITLLQLSSPVQFNKHVQPACLPRQGEELSPGTPCYITGFGKTSHPGGGSKVMMQAMLPVVSQSACSKLNTAATRIPITNSMVCAGHGPSRRESGCHGDSGGPFVCKNSQGGFTLQGAVSWGSATCSSKKSYTVFAKVSNFRSWIDQYVR